MIYERIVFVFFFLAVLCLVLLSVVFVSPLPARAACFVLFQKKRLLSLRAGAIARTCLYNVYNTPCVSFVPVRAERTIHIRIVYCTILLILILVRIARIRRGLECDSL